MTEFNDRPEGSHVANNVPDQVMVEICLGDILLDQINNIGEINLIIKHPSMPIYNGQRFVV